MKNETLRLKPYTVSEFARLYGISDRTLKKWLKPFEPEIGPRIGHFYTVVQVSVILERLGTPDEYKME